MTTIDYQLLTIALRGRSHTSIDRSSGTLVLTIDRSSGTLVLTIDRERGRSH